MTNKTNTFPKLTAAQERAWQMVLDWHDEYVHNSNDPAAYFIASGGNRGTINYRVIPGSEATFKALVKAGMLVKNEHPHDNAWGHYSIHPDFVPEYFDDEPAAPAPEPAPAAAPAPVNNAPVYHTVLLPDTFAAFQAREDIEIMRHNSKKDEDGTLIHVDYRVKADAQPAPVEPNPQDEYIQDLENALRSALVNGKAYLREVDRLVAPYEGQIHDLVTELTDALARVKELESDMERLAASEMELVQQNTLLNSVVDRLGERAATLETENTELKTAVRELVDHIKELPAPTASNWQPLRVWWISNPPTEPHYVPVNTVDDAARVLAILGDYDLYLGDLISTNAGGLQVFDEGEWTEWYSEDGDDIDEYMSNMGL